jgi:hypothetical protein
VRSECCATVLGGDSHFFFLSSIPILRSSILSVLASIAYSVLTWFDSLRVTRAEDHPCRTNYPLSLGELRI